MQHPDEGTIHAWLDGQLLAEKGDEIAAHASECPECAAMVAEARGLVAASTRILTALDDVSAGVIPAPPKRVPVPLMPRRWYDRTDLRVAAALLFVASASLVAVRRGRESTPSTAMVTMADNAKPTAPAAANTMTLESLGTEKHTENRASRPAPVPPVASPGHPSSSRNATAGMLSPLTTQPADEIRVLNAPVTDVASAPLRVLRVDSSANATRTVYEISPGVEVTLAESRVDAIAESDFAVAEAHRKNEIGSQRSADAAKERRPGSTIVGNVAGVSAGKVNQTVATASTASVPLKTISWADRGRRYTLTARLTGKELEILKTRLMEKRR